MLCRSNLHIGIGIPKAKRRVAMNLLYEEVYRKKQEQYKRDGDLQAFNSFIAKAHDYQFAIAAKKPCEREYTEWLTEQGRQAV